MKINVVIADDHPLVIIGLQHLLAGNSDTALTASFTNGTDLLQGLATNEPDVLILDIHLPGKTGDELAETIVTRYPLIKILVLTNEDNVFYIKSMLRKGVAGYILKTTDEHILLNAVRTVYNGGQYLEPVLKDKVLQDTLQSRKQLSARPVLSDREKEVLQYVAMDLTSQQMAEKIFVSKRTIDYYRLCLLTKLGVKNVGALVKKGIQLGYIK